MELVAAWERVRSGVKLGVGVGWGWEEGQVGRQMRKKKPGGKIRERMRDPRRKERASKLGIKGKRLKCAHMSKLWSLS